MKRYKFQVADIFDPEVHYLTNDWIAMHSITGIYIKADIRVYHIQPGELLNNISYKIKNNIRFIFDNLFINDEC